MGKEPTSEPTPRTKFRLRHQPDGFAVQPTRQYGDLGYSAGLMGRMQQMLTATFAKLLDYGLLSGRQTQREISELLEELYHDALE
jgi:hypothetical protein